MSVKRLLDCTPSDLAAYRKNYRCPADDPKDQA